jgi:repressor LexA
LEVLGVVKTFIATHGFPPTLRELCTALGRTSTNSVRDHLVALERKGYLRVAQGLSRGILLLPRASEAAAATAGTHAPPPPTPSSVCRHVAAQGHCEHSDAAAQTSEALETLARLVLDDDPQAKVMAGDMLAPEGMPLRMRTRFIDGGFSLDGAGWAVRLFAASFGRYVAGATNYVQQTLDMVAPTESPTVECELKPAMEARPLRILVTAVKPGRPSPHELRMQAEAKVAELEAEVLRLRALVGERAPGGVGRGG